MQRGINLVILTADDEEITENAELTSERSLIALTCKQRALPSAYVYSLDPYFTVGYVSSRNQRSLEGAAYPQLQLLNDGLALLQISAER